ncbi:hypothetical protein HK104_008206 [Borealophlyctis nickersoniae]|nr:hypothetical protein HK104_008206 [Borealophlyctis nickersoniae]
MPRNAKRKKTEEQGDSDADFVSEGSVEEDDALSDHNSELSDDKRARNKAKTAAKSAKAAKKPKTSEKVEPSNGAKVLSTVEANEEFAVPLDGKRRLTVSKFKNMTLIGIREYYTDKTDGIEKPGKKAWAAIKAKVPEIDAAIKKLEG